MTKTQRRLMSPIAYAGTMVGGPQRIAPMCVEPFKGLGWAIQVGDKCEPANIALVNAQDGNTYQVTQDEPKIVIDTIAPEQLVKVDKAIEEMAKKTLESFFGASVMFTDFIKQRYPEYYDHISKANDRSKKTSTDKEVKIR